MTDEDIDALEKYAKSIEMTRAAVCSLVIQRELKVRQLNRLSGPLQSDDNGGQTRRRVTVHVGNPELKLAFTRHVKSLGLGSDEAAFALFKSELKEQWLFNTFGLQQNHG